MNSDISEQRETIEPWLREILRCPRCKGELTDGQSPQGAELRCPVCQLAYPIDDGVPVLLVDLARPTDA
ncbi:MAG TPA: Trm112 family protein [Intrasporangium sp.]|nr:Trm112 family protein [Intrasporangium sp.]